MELLDGQVEAWKTAQNLPPYDPGVQEWGVMGERLGWNLSAVYRVHQVQNFVVVAVHHEDLVQAVLEMADAWVVRCLLAVPSGRRSQAEAGGQKTDDPCLVCVVTEEDLSEDLYWNAFSAEVEAPDDMAFVSRRPWIVSTVLEQTGLVPGSLTARTARQVGLVGKERHSYAAERFRLERQTQIHWPCHLASALVRADPS